MPGGWDKWKNRLNKQQAVLYNRWSLEAAAFKKPKREKKANK